MTQHVLFVETPLLPRAIDLKADLPLQALPKDAHSVSGILILINRMKTLVDSIKCWHEVGHATVC